jgi:hypothetical protein
MKKRNLEEIEVGQIVKWFKMQYPNQQHLFKVNYDRGTDIKQAVLQMSMNIRISDYPDIFLAIPKKEGNRIYCGLYIEMKRTGLTVLNKRTKAIKKDKHLQGQNKFLNELNDLGYFAVFGLGFENTKQLIINYMNLEKLK